MAILALGVNFSFPLWMYVGHKNPNHLAFTLKGIQKLDSRLANPGYILSLITGLGLCWYMHLNPFSVLWLWASLILYALAAATGIAVYSPLLRKQIAVLQNTGANSEEYQRLNKKGTYVGVFIFILAISIVVLMVAKPV